LTLKKVALGSFETPVNSRRGESFQKTRIARVFIQYIHTAHTATVFNSEFFQTQSSFHSLIIPSISNDVADTVLFILWLHIRLYIYTHTYIHTYRKSGSVGEVRMYVCMYVRMCVCMPINIHTHTESNPVITTSVYIYMHIYIYIYIYIYI
jgi:hypothetical protein